MPPVDRKNPIRAQSSDSTYSLMDFLREFPDDDACLEHLWRTRYAADGEHAHCPKCDQERVFKRYATGQRRQSWTCNGCGHHLHPTAGTIFHKSSTSLLLWYYAMYLMASTRCGVSAKHLERELGVTYKTAWRMFNRIRNVLMADDDHEPLTGIVEIDETSIEGMSAEPDTTDFVPPYNSFATILNMADRMRSDGIPSRVDRSYLGTWGGSARAQFMKAMKSLGFLDAENHPTTTWNNFVQDEGRRQEIIREIVQTHYQKPLSLGTNATQQQLEEIFRQYPGISGTTVRKAITFYMAACQFAGITLSPHFKKGRTTSGATTRAPARPSGQRRKAPSTPANSEGSPDHGPSRLNGLHPAIATFVQSLPEPGTEFPDEQREAWIEYARATFNLIYKRPATTQGGSA